jgi:hypothetical protein
MLGGLNGSPAATRLREARENPGTRNGAANPETPFGKISPLPRKLAISRPTLYELMEKLSISRE